MKEVIATEPGIEENRKLIENFLFSKNLKSVMSTAYTGENFDDPMKIDALVRNSDFKEICTDSATNFVFESDYNYPNNSEKFLLTIEFEEKGEDKKILLFINFASVLYIDVDYLICFGKDNPGTGGMRNLFTIKQLK